MKLQLSSITAEELYYEFKKQLKKDKTPQVEGLSFSVGQPTEKDAERIFKFLMKNASDYILLQQFTKSSFCKSFMELVVSCVTAYEGNQVVGYLSLAKNTDLNLLAIAHPCVRKDKKKVGIYFYMLLCAFKFAKEHLHKDAVAVGVYRSENPRRHLLDALEMKSLKDSIELWGSQGHLDKLEKYSHDREVYLYKTYEQTLGLKLRQDKQGNYFYKFEL